MVPVKTDKDSTRSCMYDQKYGRKLVKPLRIEIKQEWAKEKPKLDNARRLRGIFFIDPDDQDYKLSNTQEEQWKYLWHPSCLVKELQMASRKCLHNRRLHPRRLQKRFMVEKWNHKTPQGNEWNLLSLKIMKIMLQVKDLLR